VASLAVRYARFALGAAFLSSVAARFGVWGHWSWAEYEQWVRELNWFLPAFAIPPLAVLVTLLEGGLGLALVLGASHPWVARGAALLLAVFGLAMAIADGPKEPLDYSVFSASACALLLDRRSAPPFGGAARRE